MPFATLENFDLYYETRGAGEPLILISGFASGAWIWYRQIEDLAKSFTVITFDPRGVGQSRIPAQTAVSIEAIADDAALLLEKLEIEKAHVLGASFGGFVAQEFALKYPPKLGKLILACTSFGGKNHVAPAPEVLTAFAPAPGLNSAARVRQFMLPAFTKEFAAKNAAEVEKVCRLREAVRVPETVYTQQLASATSFDVEHRLSEITAQTLVLSGDRDLIVPPANAENLARAIPNVRLVMTENGSHLFFIEKADEFNRAVSKFIKNYSQ